MADARWAGPGDKGDVERLFLEYLALQGEDLDRIGFAKTWRESLRPGSRFRFAVIGGKNVRVAAFATVHDSYSSRAAGATVRLEDLFVDPDHAGKGYRQRLVAFAEDYARRQRAKQIDVFLQAETSVDPDFLPKGFEPLASPPFRKVLVARRTSKAAPVRAPSARRGRKAGNGAHNKVPKGKELTELFQ